MADKLNKIKKFVLRKFTIDKLKLNEDKNQLIAAGEGKAHEIPVSNITKFKPGNRDVIKMINSEEDKMIPELIPLRHKRMMKNTFSFFRGTASVMGYDLLHERQSQIPVMICGDAHINNFGFFASPERQLLFGLNDFDETRVGNWEVDLKRLLVSVQLSGELNGYKEKNIKKILKGTVAAYRAGIKYSNSLKVMNRFYLSYNIDDLLDLVSNDDKQMKKLLKKIAKKAPKNNSNKVVKKFTSKGDDGEIVFTENPPRARRIPNKLYTDFIKAIPQYLRSVSQDVQVLLSNFRVSDIIRYSVGVGSFGTRCYLVLLTAKDNSHLVLQIKEALPSRFDLTTMTRMDAQKQAPEEGKRIITGQRILQTFSDPFLGSMNVGDRSFYVRQFRDMKDSVKVNKLNKNSFNAYTHMCAFILAVAHFQSPTAAMIYGYIAESKKFDKHFTDWATAYSKQVHKDYATFKHYLKSGVDKN